MDKKKRIFSCYRLVYGISLLCTLAPAVCASLLRRSFAGAEDVAAGLLTGAAVLLTLPISEERMRPSIQCAPALAAVCLGGTLAGLPARQWLCAVLLFLFLFLLWRSMAYYVQSRALFRQFAVWTNVEHQARHAYAEALYLLAMFFPLSGRTGWAAWLVPAAAAALNVLLHIRVWTGRTLFVSLAKELEIKELIKGNLRPAPAQAGDQTENLARMTRVYSRVTAYMEQKRPYLDEEFSLEDLATRIFTNKSYLSRTINVMSGRNFSQFVNYYRVQYSMELMRKDPHLKILDLAMMSGFHTTVTFTMAFKFNTGETPSQYLERIRAERRWK
ncbi:MAG: helix-turn-helix transcriptional regulator [Bacteroidales bacterium]|nr:helix-turn-helix transcriptional regulator [Bacteroidales bacterium]